MNKELKETVYDRIATDKAKNMYWSVIEVGPNHITELSDLHKTLNDDGYLVNIRTTRKEEDSPRVWAEINVTWP